MYLFLSRLIGILDVGIGHELSLERLKRRGQVGAPWKILKRETRRVQKRTYTSKVSRVMSFQQSRQLGWSYCHRCKLQRLARM